MEFCLPHLAPGIKHTVFCHFLCLMSRFHTHIFLFHLANLIVGDVGDFLRRQGKRILP